VTTPRFYLGTHKPAWLWNPAADFPLFVSRRALSELPVHGFGVKTQGLAVYGAQLTSADSLAWSLDARRSDPLPGHAHKSCSNCLEYASQWRADLLDQVDTASARPDFETKAA